MVDVTTETAPADDLRSAIMLSMEGEAPETTVAEVKPEEKPEPEVKSDRARNEDGTFAKAEKTEEVAEPEKPEAKAEQTEAEPEKTEEPKTEDTVAPEFQKALTAWKPADQEMFKKLAPDAQQFVMRRYKEMEGDYTKKLQGISRLKTEYEPIDQMFAPYREQMKAKGFSPAGLVEAWSNVEKKLIAGEDSAIDVVRGIVSGYKISPAKLAAALGITGGQQQRPIDPLGVAGQQNQPQPVALPPELMNELNALKQTVTGLTTAQQNAARRAQEIAAENAETEAEKFRSAKDDKGNLLHPYIDDVEGQMLALAQASIANKQPVPPPQELYETAVWANPSVREKLLTAREQAKEKTRKDQETAKAAAAKKAAVSVTGAPGAGQAPAVRGQSERSLREELEANMADAAA